MNLKIIVISFFIFFEVISGKSQTLNSELLKIFKFNKQEELKDYLGPLSQTFGVNLSSGIYYSAESYIFPHLDFGISYTSTAIPSNKLWRGSPLKSPTIFGKVLEDSVHLSGLNIRNFQLPVFHLSIGIGDNTNLILRYTNWDMEKIGRVKLFGAGIKYELENLLSISPIPLNVAILAVYQKYQVNNFLEGAVFTMNIIGSKDLGIIPLSIYGGAGYLNNITNINNPNGDKEESYSVDGLEEVKYQLGIRYSVLFFQLSTEYNFGQYNSFNIGMRIVL